MLNNPIDKVDEDDANEKKMKGRLTGNERNTKRKRKEHEWKKKRR